MLGGGESPREVIRPDFNRSIMIDCQSATISSDPGFILLKRNRPSFPGQPGLNMGVLTFNLLHLIRQF
jgi:hypothetical protein